jgi:hypothetical protein
MAEVKTPSTKDLLLLLTGFYVPQLAPQQADSGQDYWLTKGSATQERELREAIPNQEWLKNPGKAWDDVRFRDWLVTLLFGAMASYKNEFVAIHEPLLASIDVLGKEFTHDMKDVTESIRKALNPLDGRPRSLLNTLSVGISRHDVSVRRQINNQEVLIKKEVFMFGAGIRRRARFWRTESMALQAAVEFFVPFYEIPNSEPSTGISYHTNSINAGIALSYSDGSPIGKDGSQELMAVRFNLRAPFGTNFVEDPRSIFHNQLQTAFDPPVIQIQKRVRDNKESAVSGWETFQDWKEFVEKFCESYEGIELLNAPIGPMLLEMVDDGSGLVDILLDKKESDIKSDLTKSLKEFNDTLDLLDNIHKVKSPEKDGAGENVGKHRLGHLLESLGFLKAKPKWEWELKIHKDLTVWDVLNGLFAELDGYPFYVKGTKPKTKHEPRIAISLASKTSETDATTSHFGLGGLLYNIPLVTVPPDTPPQKEKEKSYDERVQIIVDQGNFFRDRNINWDDDDEEEFGVEPKPKPAEEAKSTTEVFLHLGKWFSDETLDDNWYKRLLPKGESQLPPRVPVPGIRFLPFKRTSKLNAFGNQEAAFSWSFLIDLVSLGVDIKGKTKEGLTFLKSLTDRFGLGAVEIRASVKFSGEDISARKDWYERFSLGIGVKLKDLRLSLGPKEEDGKKKDKADGDDFMRGIQYFFPRQKPAAEVPAKPQENKVKTRLSAKKRDKFSLSFGYLTPLTGDSKGTLDVQLYDEKGKRGKMAYIEIDRSVGPFYLRRIGISLAGVENLELAGGLPDTARLTVAITCGLRFQVFELGVINGKMSFQLNDASAFRWGFDGLDVSVKLGSIVISGTFFKSGLEYAGMLTLDFPKASFSAMGFYGNTVIGHIESTPEKIRDLNGGSIPEELGLQLVKLGITPRSSPLETGTNKWENYWELYSENDTRYLIREDDGKLNLMGDEKTFFVYGVLNAAAGCGPTLGPIQFTGIALGYGYNRRLKVPVIEEVADFPMVKMVMGEGGADDTPLKIESRLSTPLEDPVKMLEKMKDYVVAEAGQQFGCLGVRFTVSGVIDCFALMVVQWGGNDIELAMLGLGRFRHPRDPKTAPICFVEIQMLMSFKLREGTFQLQALLTSNSWIINKDCKLTGGFALFIWFDGPHKGDWVITFGGYHPRFVRPAHYPIVPRIGLNWRVSNNLTMKGSMYLAITPSCGMLGARLEASFHSGRVSAWYTAYLDVIVNWQPLYFEAELGISLRVHVSLWITTLKVTIGASIRLWGPPVGGIAHIDLAVISFDIEFGAKPKQPELVSSWQQFCHNFLNMSGAETRPVNEPVPAFAVVAPTLASGRNNVNNIPNSRRDKPSDKRDDEVWIVRGDELELAADTAIPVSSVNIGAVAANSSAEGIVSSGYSGKSLMVNKPLVINKPLKSKRMLRSNPTVGAHPMGKSLNSVLNVTIVNDEVAGPVMDVSGWTMEEETSALPAAVWDPARPNLRPSEPSAKLIDGCITGIKKLRPPRGKLGNHASPAIQWHVLLVGVVRRSETSQEIPGATVNRDVQPLVVARQDNQKKVAAALAAAGFALTWEATPVADVRFRELQADPLGGAVAA